MATLKPAQNNRPAWQPSPVISPKLQKQIGKIYELWDELSDFGLDKTDAALEYCMKRISTLLDAQDSFWVGAVHVLKNAPRKKLTDSLSGWRVRAVRPLHPQYHHTRHYKKVVKEANHSDLELGDTNIALAAGSGRFRAYTLQSGSLVDVKPFQRTAHYDFYYRQHGIRDRIWVVSPVNADIESYFCFDRIGDRKRRFDEADLELAAFALRGIKWFHRQLMLSHGLGLCEEPLTPAEHRVIQGLLTGATEREIAEAVGHSPGTVHQYATRIYQKFGVRGRTEFTALWLSGNSSAKATAPESGA